MATFKKEKIVLISVLLIGVLLVSSLIFVYAKTANSDSIKVNELTLPDLDKMYPVEANGERIGLGLLGATSDVQITPYKQFQNNIGLDLLNSPLGEYNPYMQIEIRHNDTSSITAVVKNYILGDTSNYSYNLDGHYYTYDEGLDYLSPINMEISIIPSSSQEEGFDVDYLGYYEFKENFISDQGYRVNLLEDTFGEDSPEHENLNDYISEKIAIFVADGIRYTITGRTSTENIKNIVNNLVYEN